MRKYILLAAVAALPAIAMAQSAVDAYSLAPSDLRGTARFMSMAGAFGALGGDLSTLTQNPAGIGVYRSSEVGITLDINMTSSRTNSGSGFGSMDKTHVYCNNFGYVGTTILGGETMPTFSWGASYNRAASFDRSFRGSIGDLGTSMSNYVANFSRGYSPDELGETTSYNPFQSPKDIDWMSIMAYNSYLITPSGPDGTYNGLWVPGTTYGNAAFTTRERGYVDEYSINFGGNIMNTLYWGVGFGITDINMTQDTFYDEELTDADVYSKQNNIVTPGNAYYALRNHSNTSGSGFNMKFGVILKPINEFRLGLAIHTPTWYNLSTHYASTIDYSYGYDFNADGLPTNSNDGQYYSDDAYYDWHMKSPWRLIASAAGVIGGRFILSADYEYKAFNNMSVSVPVGYGDFEKDEYVSEDAKAYYKPTNTVRIGAEYRITPQFSLRAGYSHASTSVSNEANNGDIYVSTSGTNPAYTMNKGTDYITLGLGYRSGGFYVDAAYVYKKTSSTWHAFSSYEDPAAAYAWTLAPRASLDNKNNNIVLSIGYKF